MPNQNLHAARPRIALLATTALVMAGCNTTSTPVASAYPSSAEPAPHVSKASESPTGKGLNFASLMRVADRARARGDAPTALRLYAAAAEQDATNPLPLVAIGDLLREGNRLDQAAAAYDQALARDRNNLAALLGLGYTQLQLDRPYQASQQFLRALEIKPDDARSLGGLGVAFDKAGDHQEAQNYYRKAIKADPDNLNYKSNLALSLALSGKTDQGIAILKPVTELPEATAKHRQTLALIYGLAGKSGEAMKYSRMDLSEEEARNNALYFAALNGETDKNVPTLDEQIRAMKAVKQGTVVAEPLAAEMPRPPADPDRLVASMETEHLGTEAKQPKPSEAAPKSLTPTTKAPLMIAAAETAPATPAATSSGETKLAPVVTAEAPKQSSDEQIVAHAETLKQQAAAPAEQLATNIPAAAEKTPAPAREWTLVSKPAAPTMPPKAAPKTVVADSDSASEAPVMKVAFTSPHDAYKPDGGKYYLQIGSYKDKPLAEKGWNILKSQNPDLLGDVEPVYSYADLGEGNGGVHYRLQIGGFTDKGRMMDLCAALQTRQFDCFMASPQNAGPTKEPALAPDQRMVETPAVPAARERGMIADTEEFEGVF